MANGLNLLNQVITFSDNVKKRELIESINFSGSKENLLRNIIDEDFIILDRKSNGIAFKAVQDISKLGKTINENQNENQHSDDDLKYLFLANIPQTKTKKCIHYIYIQFYDYIVTKEEEENPKLPIKFEKHKEIFKDDKEYIENLKDKSDSVKQKIRITGKINSKDVKNKYKYRNSINYKNEYWYDTKNKELNKENVISKTYEKARERSKKLMDEAYEPGKEITKDAEVHLDLYLNENNTPIFIDIQFE